jgi:hypothetical protein
LTIGDQDRGARGGNEVCDHHGRIIRRGVHRQDLVTEDLTSAILDVGIRPGKPRRRRG